MKHIFTFILMALITMPIISQELNHYCDKDLESIIENERRRGGHQLNARSTNLNNNYDITHQTCEWTIDPDVYYIEGVITTTFTPTQPNIQTIEFDLYNNMVVNSVIFEGTSLLFTQTTDNLLQVTLGQTVNMGESYEIAVDYEGSPDSAGFGSFNQSTHGPDNTSILWTLSEPYGASTWWPCKQDNVDKIDNIDIYVTVPEGNKVGSNGLLVGIETPMGTTDVTYHWQHNHPITSYLVAISVTNYVEYTDIGVLPNGDQFPILNYVYPESLANAQASTPNIIPIMELFSNLFGDYPFADEKYGHAQFPWGGGMEHQTMSFMVNFGFSLMAHEVAHQWFGDDITCGSWEDLWLNESFATYLTGLAKKNIQGSGAFYDWKSNVSNYVTGQPGGSVWVDDTTSVNRLFNSRLTYNKGAFVLHMLRWKVGDDAFFQGIQNYRTNHSDGYAVTDDLKFEIENTSGLDLTEFLSDWFYNQGYPTYDVVVNTSEGATTASVVLNQSTSHTSVDFFEMPVPVLLSLTDGTDTMFVFDHTSSGQIFSIDLPAPIGSVLFDPELKILSRDNTISLNTLVATDNILSNSKIYIYPNPATDNLFIINKDSANELESFEVFDVTGRLILAQEATERNNVIELNKFNKGIYTLKITSKKGIVSKRFVVR